MSYGEEYHADNAGRLYHQTNINMAIIEVDSNGNLIPGTPIDIRHEAGRDWFLIEDSDRGKYEIGNPTTKELDSEFE